MSGDVDTNAALAALEASLGRCVAQLFGHLSGSGKTVCWGFAMNYVCTRPKCRLRHPLRPAVFEPTPLGGVCNRVVHLLPLLRSSSSEARRSAVAALDEQGAPEVLSRLLLAPPAADAALLDIVLGHFVPILMEAFAREKKLAPALQELWMCWRQQQCEEPARAALLFKSLPIDHRDELSAQIADWAATQIREHGAESAVRSAVCEALADCLRRVWPEARVVPFGSAVNGFGGRGSDLDVVIEVDSAAAKDAPAFLAQAAQLAAGAGFEVVELVISARVPVLKLRDKASGLCVDAALNNRNAIRNTALLRAYSRYAQLRWLGHAVKLWAKRRGVALATNSTLTAYAWVVLAVFYMQQSGAVPNLQEDEEPGEGADSSRIARLLAAEDDLPCDTTQSMGELLIGFFNYYAFAYGGFDFNAFAVSIRLARKVPRYSDKASAVASRGEGWRFVIEDPYEDHDLGRVIRDPRGQLHVGCCS